MVRLSKRLEAAKPEIDAYLSAKPDEDWVRRNILNNPNVVKSICELVDNLVVHRNLPTHPKKRLPKRIAADNLQFISRIVKKNTDLKYKARLLLPYSSQLLIRRILSPYRDG